MKALIDADLVAYRCAAACENESLQTAIARSNSMIEDIIIGVDHDDRYYDSWKLFLTGSNNYRHSVATTATYKGNRTKEKPKHLLDIRKQMVEEWGAEICEGQEADDGIAIEATALGNDCIIVSLDKDFDQIPVWRYIFTKKIWKFQTEQEAVKSFYKQVLMGDSADNIIGLYKVGPVKAEKMLKDCINELDMYNVCLEAYNSPERVLENARLLWLRRLPNQMWEPPVA